MKGFSREDHPGALQTKQMYASNLDPQSKWAKISDKLTIKHPKSFEGKSGFFLFSSSLSVEMDVMTAQRLRLYMTLAPLLPPL